MRRNHWPRVVSELKCPPEHVLFGVEYEHSNRQYPSTHPRWDVVRADVPYLRMPLQETESYFASSFARAAYALT